MVLTKRERRGLYPLGMIWRHVAFPLDPHLLMEHAEPHKFPSALFKVIGLIDAPALVYSFQRMGISA
jgi:hypothetical protein